MATEKNSFRSAYKFPIYTSKYATNYYSIFIPFSTTNNFSVMFSFNSALKATKC